MRKKLDKLEVNFDYFGRYHNIDNVHSLKSIGAGHDGIVYSYGDLALKINKYDLESLNVKDLMTYEKARIFSKMTLKRLIAPRGVILDSNGVYCGYIMRLIDKAKDDVSLNLYKSDQLLQAIYDLKSDFSEVSQSGFVAEDINNGSFLLDKKSFLYLCDADKYTVSKVSVSARNNVKLNYAISRFLTSKMTGVSSKEKSSYVKESSNNTFYLNDMERQLISNNYSSVGEYVEEVKENLVKKR